MPALFLAGERDAKFTSLARRMATLAPDARTASVASAGHTAHLEAPRAWLAHVRGFAKRLPKEGPS